MSKPQNFAKYCRYIREKQTKIGREYKSILIFGSITSEMYENIIILKGSDTHIFNFFGNPKKTSSSESNTTNAVQDSHMSIDGLKDFIMSKSPELIIFGEFDEQLKDFLTLSIRKVKSEVIIPSESVMRLRHFIISMMAMRCYSSRSASDLLSDNDNPVFLCWDE